MYSVKLAAAVFHGFAGDEEVVEDAICTENFFVEWSGVGCGFTPNRGHLECICQPNQSMEQTCAHTSNLFANRADDLRMNGHEVHNEVVTPTAAAVGQTQNRLVSAPFGNGQKHESHLCAGFRRIAACNEARLVAVSAWWL